jgi:hypothetical protein
LGWQHVPDTGVAEQRVLTAAHQAFWVLLRLGFTAAPILFGLDKFFNWSVNWPVYLASSTAKSVANGAGAL